MRVSIPALGSVPTRSSTWLWGDPGHLAHFRGYRWKAGIKENALVFNSAYDFGETVSRVWESKPQHYGGETFQRPAVPTCNAGTV